MWLLSEKLSDFGVKQILYRVDIALYVHPKNSLRSHVRAIMVLDHSRLGVEKKFLENKSGRIFCVRQVYKFLPINLGACKPIFYFFIHHIWGERVLWGAVFIIQSSYKMQYFTIFQDKLHLFNIQDHWRTRRLLISETVQKISKITYTASRF